MDSGMFALGTGERDCAQCGGTFSAPMGRLSTKRYCSAPCRKRFHDQRRREYRAARRRGELVAATECERCGSSENIQGHHADYDRQLEVEWLCQRCHVLEHPTWEFVGG